MDYVPSWSKNTRIKEKIALIGKITGIIFKLYIHFSLLKAVCMSKFEKVERISI